jgi:hypothetical protein
MPIYSPEAGDCQPVSGRSARLPVSPLAEYAGIE